MLLLYGTNPRFKCGVGFYEGEGGVQGVWGLPTNSSSRFRSYVLSVMSRTRFHCATLLT